MNKNCTKSLGSTLHRNNAGKLLIASMFIILGSLFPVNSNSAFAADINKLSSLSPKDFAKTLAKSSDSDIEKLWRVRDRNLKDKIIKICNSDNVKAVAKYISKYSSKKKKSMNYAKMKRLVYFYQIAFYHEAYQSALSYDKATKEKVVKSLTKLGLHRKFYSKKSSAAKLRTQWAISIDSTNGLANATKVLVKLVDRAAKSTKILFNKKTGKSTEEFETIKKLFYSLRRQTGIHSGKGESSIWYKAFEGKATKSIIKIAIKKSKSNHVQDLSKEAIELLGYYLPKFSPDTKEQCHWGLTNALKTHKKTSALWYWAAKSIVDTFGSKTANNKKIDGKQIKKAFINALFPHINKYDKNRIIIHSALSKERADKVGKELVLIREQFFKICPHKKAVKGDKNKVLHVYIYPNRKAYDKYHWDLFRTSVDNGGIFIESRGHFYTFDRKCPEENIYTLEELSRHEYTHYLDSRYNLWGGYEGDGTVFKKAPVAWYLEGLAEALTGTIKGKGVLPRRKLLSRIKNPMTLAKLTTCTYQKDGFSFYNDGGIFFCYLINKKPDLLKKMFKTLRANKKEDIVKLFRFIATDKNLQDDYSKYFNKLREKMHKKEKIFFEDFAK